MSPARLRLVRPGPPPSPAGRTAPPWWLVATLGILIGIVAQLAGGCTGNPALREPTRIQTDEERCAAKGGFWTWMPSKYGGQWHCLARRP